jgi:hypothetical protein
MSDKVKLDTHMLPPIKVELILGEIKENVDGSASLPVQIDWLNLQEVLQEFVIKALEEGIKKQKVVCECGDPDCIYGQHSFTP